MYFKGLRRTDERALIQELRVSMKDPKKAIVNVSFIGGSVVEVLTDSSSIRGRHAK